MTGAHYNGQADPNLKNEAEKLRRIFEDTMLGHADRPRLDLSQVDEIVIRGKRYLQYPDGSWRTDWGEQINPHQVIPVITPGEPNDYSFDPLDPSTLEGVPISQQQWVALGWVPMERLTGLYGGPGEGKTTLAQMLATACAIDVEWFPGIPVQQCNSLLLLCEDDLKETHRRQDAINRHYGCSYRDIGAMRWLPRLGSDNSLMDFKGFCGLATRLYSDIRDEVLKRRVKLVVIDTLADVYVENENDRAKVVAFGRRILGRLALDTGACVMPLGWPSVRGANTGESGSTAWRGVYRSHLLVDTPVTESENGEPTQIEDPDLRTLWRKKANYARRGDSLDLKWENGGA